MAKGDILDKLKIAGYVTSTDPSGAVEDALDIHEGGDVPTGTIEITENGEGIDVSSYATANVDVSTGGTVDESSVSKFIGVSVYTYDVDPDTGGPTFVSGALLNHAENSDPVIITPEFISDYETKVAEEKSAHTAAGDLDNYQLQDLTDPSYGAVTIGGDWYDVRIWDFQPDDAPDFILFEISSATYGSQPYYYPIGSCLFRKIGENIYCFINDFTVANRETFVRTGVNAIDKIMFIQGSTNEIYPRIAEGRGVPALYYPSQEQPSGGSGEWLGQCKFVWVELTPQNP